MPWDLPFGIVGFQPPCPPLLGDDKKRRGASPLCTPLGRLCRGALRCAQDTSNPQQTAVGAGPDACPLLSFPRKRESSRTLCLPAPVARGLISPVSRAAFNPLAPTHGGMIKELGDTPNPRQESLLHVCCHSRGSGNPVARCACQHPWAVVSSVLFQGLLSTPWPPLLGDD
jgi:hypothetical protein